MNAWRHSICRECWDKKNPGHTPYVIREEFRDEAPEKCCFCGRMHGSGIYVREDPAGLLCNGQHES